MCHRPASSVQRPSPAPGLPSRASKPYTATCFRIVASTSSLGFSEPFFRLGGIVVSMVCFCGHCVRVSRCRFLPTPLLAPTPLAAEASPAMWAARSHPKSRDRFFRPMTAHPACVSAYHSLSPKLSAMGTCVEQIIFSK